MRSHSKKTLLVMISVVLTLIILIVPTTAAEKGQHPLHSHTLHAQTSVHRQRGDMGSGDDAGMVTQA